MTVRSFVIATKLPFPTRSGADLRTWQIVKALSSMGPVAVFGIGHSEPASPPLTNIEIWQSTSQATAQLHNASPDDVSWIREAGWRPSDWFYHEGIEAEIAESLRLFRPDVVVLEQLSTAGYLGVARSSGAVLVLDNHNIETQLQIQIAESETVSMKRFVRRQFAERTRLLEHATIAEVDAVWVCSEADRLLAIEQFGAEVVDVVPNGIDVDDGEQLFRARRAELPQAPTIIFPAQFGYAPNRTAAEYIVDEIAPAMTSAIPGSRIVLPGRDPSEKMMNAAVQGLVDVPGSVPSMTPYLRSADLMIIPLREGSGTRLKAIEAFATGLPLISTSKGVEGLDVIAGDHYLPAETPVEFVDAVLQLRDGRLVDRLRQNARSLVASRYSANSVAAAVTEALVHIVP